MKITNILFGLVFVLLFYILGPLIFIYFNSTFQLPTINIFLLKIIGILMIVFGFLFIIYLFFVFKKEGKGTPIILEGTKRLMHIGPYKFTRNPMYLAHLWILFGIFLIFGSVFLLLYLFLAWFGMDLFLAKIEEPQLQRKFGNDYENYLKKVPRWIAAFH